MIYGDNSSIKLYGKVADNFLEEVGVDIFDDGDIAIGESIFDLSTGCDILEENGIVLCEDCIVLESEAAEKYKARKAKEKADREEAEEKRNRRRFNPDNSTVGDQHNNSKTLDAIKNGVRNNSLYGDYGEEFRNATRKRDKDEMRANNAWEYVDRNVSDKSDMNKVFNAYDKVNKRFRSKPSEHKKFINSRFAGNDKLRKHALKTSGIKESTIFSDIEII